MNFAAIMKDEINRKRKKIDSDLKVNEKGKKDTIFNITKVNLFFNPVNS